MLRLVFGFQGGPDSGIRIFIQQFTKWNASYASLIIIQESRSTLNLKETIRNLNLDRTKILIDFALEKSLKKSGSLETVTQHQKCFSEGVPSDMPSIDYYIARQFLSHSRRRRSQKRKKNGPYSGIGGKSKYFKMFLFNRIFYWFGLFRMIVQHLQLQQQHLEKHERR